MFITLIFLEFLLTSIFLNWKYLIQNIVIAQHVTCGDTCPMFTATRVGRVLVRMVGRIVTVTGVSGVSSQHINIVTRVKDAVFLSLNICAIVIRRAIHQVNLLHQQNVNSNKTLKRRVKNSKTENKILLFQMQISI